MTSSQLNMVKSQLMGLGVLVCTRTPEWPVSSLKTTYCPLTTTVSCMILYKTGAKCLPEPPFVESHGKTHGLEGQASKKWNAANVKYLLLPIGVKCEHSVGMLRQVMCPV